MFNVSSLYFSFVFAYSISVWLILYDFWMYNVILCSDRKAYSCPTKWLPQDRASSGKQLSFWLLPKKTALRQSLGCTGGGTSVWVLPPMKKCLTGRTWIWILICVKTIRANVSRQIRKCAFSASTNARGCLERWAESVSVRGKVRVWVGDGVCVCVCVQVQKKREVEDGRGRLDVQCSHP